MEGFGLSERLVTAGEFAAILQVTEDDVLGWMLSGWVPYVDGDEGEPRVRIFQEHHVDGPISTGLVSYSIRQDREFEAELARRRRELHLAALDWGVVNVDALADALASRLAAVAPEICEVSAQASMIWLRDRRGGSAGIDIAFAASFPESGTGPQRMKSAAEMFLEQAQDELAEMTTDPWPRQGRGTLPTPRAELISDETELRLFYGEPDDPVLELESVRISGGLTN